MQLLMHALTSTLKLGHGWVITSHYAGGPRRPPPPQLQLRRSRDLAHASIPLAQTPWGLTGRAWLQAGAQQAVIAVDPSFNSLGIDSRNATVLYGFDCQYMPYIFHYIPGTHPSLHRHRGHGDDRFLWKSQFFELPRQGIYGVGTSDEESSRSCASTADCSMMHECMTCMIIVIKHIIVLTHWGWGKMAEILQTSFSNVFSSGMRVFRIFPDFLGYKNPEIMQIFHILNNKNHKIVSRSQVSGFLWKACSHACFLNENFCILIQISLKYVSKVCIDNKSELFQIMAWCLFGTKPLTEPIMTSFADVYMRSQWVN